MKQVKNTSERNIVVSVDRTIDILEYLLSKNWAVTIKELSVKLNIPKATVFRIIKTLERRGYISSPGRNGGYILGVKTISLGNSISEESNLNQIANPFMFELAEKSGHTVQLGVLFEYQVMYIAQIQTTKPISVIVPTGTPFPVNLSAGGKVLVSNLSNERFAEFVKYAELKANTPKSIVDKESFIKELVEVKKRGYAVDYEEFARGIWCVAAPIWNFEGKNIASLGITGHISEIDDDKLANLVRITVDISNQISRALGHQR
jgi:DNA-binding IclR family transcriptional regulator